ncbi:hypothetical protein HMI55_003900 [Coelomomyces lativittatus]|nr:hypothetical protein HMI55_003900 [Coelomomyces lativittatus]
MKHLLQDKHVMAIASIPNLLDKLKQSFEELELIQKGLNHYLEVKRLYFPRFFFLSNDEMLEILSETRDPLRVQPHLKKCFEGVNTLQFEENLDISGMYSALKEYIPFTKKISTVEANGAVEKWLLEVEKNMLTSVYDIIFQALSDYKELEREAWVLKWPGQAILTVSQIFWTQDVEFAINSNNLQEFADGSAIKLKKIVELVRGNLSKVVRSTLEALVVIDVHARDVLNQLIEAGIESPNDFDKCARQTVF